MSLKSLRVPLLLAGASALILLIVGCSMDSPTQAQKLSASSKDAAPVSVVGSDLPTVVSPKGGERINIGQSYTIVWDYPATLNLTPDWTASVYLSDNSGKTFTYPIGKVNYPTAKDLWNVTGPETRLARIEVVLTDPAGKYPPLIGESGADFVIAADTLTSPATPDMGVSESK